MYNNMNDITKKEIRRLLNDNSGVILIYDKVKNCNNRLITNTY